uniref:Uncharacterized protein n=1 Tax=Candidozyma auris TaxID=498019 RepID=A0A0L0NU55_CANAR
MTTDWAYSQMRRRGLSLMRDGTCRKEETSRRKKAALHVVCRTTVPVKDSARMMGAKKEKQKIKRKKKIALPASI